MMINNNEIDDYIFNILKRKVEMTRYYDL